MAIKIPSKHIYSKDNPKIRDNIIERLEINSQDISVEYQYNNLINKSTYYISNTAIDNTDNHIVLSNLYTPDLSSLFLCHFLYMDYANRFILKPTEIKIPIVNGNKKITSILTGKDTNGRNNIKYTLYGNYSYGTIEILLNATLDWLGGNTFTLDIDKTPLSVRHYDAVNTTFGQYEIPTSIQYSTNADTSGNVIQSPIYGYEAFSGGKSIFGNVDSAKFEKIIENDVEYIKTEIEGILCGCIIEKARATVELDANNITIPENGYQFEPKLYGSYNQYSFDSIELEFYGDIIGLNIKDKTIYVPNEDKTSKRVFNFDGNEIIQTKNVYTNNILDENEYTISIVDNPSSQSLQTVTVTLKKLRNNIVYIDYLDNTNNNTLTTIEIAVGSLSASFVHDARGSLQIQKIYLGKEDLDGFYSKILSNYTHGKETATIRCSISDYYDYVSNDKVIAIDNSTSKMTFDLYDQVIPMVYGANGQDKPMSLNKDGTPKVFNVLGTKTYYDGAVWQELSLQEA